jgi:hypothetical protein
MRGLPATVVRIIWPLWIGPLAPPELSRLDSVGRLSVALKRSVSVAGRSTRNDLPGSAIGDFDDE